MSSCSAGYTRRVDNGDDAFSSSDPIGTGGDYEIRPVPLVTAGSCTSTASESHSATRQESIQSELPPSNNNYEAQRWIPWYSSRTDLPSTSNCFYFGWITKAIYILCLPTSLIAIYTQMFIGINFLVKRACSIWSDRWKTSVLRFFFCCLQSPTKSHVANTWHYDGRQPTDHENYRDEIDDKNFIVYGALVSKFQNSMIDLYCE